VMLNVFCIHLLMKSASIFKLRLPVIQQREWNYLCAHLEIHEKTIYSIEYFLDGFRLNSQIFFLRYFHAMTVTTGSFNFLRLPHPLRKNQKLYPVTPPIKYVELVVHKVDQGNAGYALFRNVNELAGFLKVNPMIAEALEYVPKKNS
jgi:hypothetical protein